MHSAGLLLLLAQEQPLQVPNKLYEYLATGVPILAIADHDGETADMLRQVGGHYVLPPDDLAGMEMSLESALGLPGGMAPGNPRHDLLAEWTSAVQMGRLKGMVDSLF
jgi:hypothetical protein